jgi:hypothetical protein
MKHKYEKWIHLMADGVRIETDVNGEWIGAYWGDFNDNNLTFRIAPKQPADKEGWIPWFGGENPAPGKWVDVFFRLGNRSNLLADNLDWRQTGRGGDIVAYRIVKQVKKWRWMFFYPASIQPSAIYMSEPFTEDQATKYFDGFTRLRVKPEWKMEVCDE